jgi:hypothetical protein
MINCRLDVSNTYYHYEFDINLHIVHPICSETSCYDANMRIVIIGNLSINPNIKPFPIHANNQQKEYENIYLVNIQMDLSNAFNYQVCIK